jgi:two-component system, cell cycle sensor histidine kinase and response regulator CckA
MPPKPTYEELKRKIKDLERSEAEHKKTADMHQETREQLRLLTEQSLLAIVIVREDKIEYANNAFVELTGYSLEEILKWKTADTVKLIHPDYRDFVLEQGRKKMQGELTDVVVNYQYKGVKKDGEIQWVDQYSQSVTYNGKPANMISMLNIHQRKITEEALKRSEERYRALFDRSLDGVFIHDLNGNFVDANAVMKKFIGYGKDEKPVLNFSSLLYGDQLTKVWDALNQAKETGFMKEVSEFRVQHKDGGFVDLEVISSLILRDGKPYAIQGIARDITERKKAEDALQESEERYRALFHRSNDCIFINDFDGNYIDANPAGLELLGYEEKDISRVNMADLLPDDELIKGLTAMEEVIRTGSMKNILEQRIRRKDGTFVYVELKGTLIHRNEKPYAIQGVGRDITERKKTEETLKESQERYNALFDRSNDCVYINDLEGKFIDANAVALESLGYTKDEITSLNFASLINGDQLARAIGEMEDVIKTGSMKHAGEFQLRRKNGTFVDMEIKTALIYRHGKPYAVQGIARDITERKMAEEALRKSEERFRDLYENAPIAYFSARAEDTAILRCNKAATELGGYSREEVLQMRVIDIYSDLEEDRVKAFELLERLKNGESIRDEELRIKHKDGRHIWVSYSVEPIRDDTGNVIESRSIGVDISERKRLQQQLQEARKMEAIASLAGGVAHQFNNALSVIKGNVDLLKLGLIGENGISDCADQMTKSVFKMIKLTEQLLGYAKGGKYQTMVIPFKNMLSETLPLIRHSVKPSILIETDMPDENVHILADKTQLQMVLSAVIINASEAIDDQGCIRIACVRETIDENTVESIQGPVPGNYAGIEISDDGRGMNKETLSRIFEPFFSTKFHGRGLSMAAAYGIIKNHDGWVFVDSKEGKGTCVKILLPLVERVNGE